MNLIISHPSTCSLIPTRLKLTNSLVGLVIMSEYLHSMRVLLCIAKPWTKDIIQALLGSCPQTTTLIFCLHL